MNTVFSIIQDILSKYMFSDYIIKVSVKVYNYIHNFSLLISSNDSINITDNNLFFKDPYGVYSTISTDNLSSSIALYDSMLVTLDRSPLIAEAFFKLGEIQYRMFQDFDKAYVLFSKAMKNKPNKKVKLNTCLLYTSPSPRD